MRPHIRSSPRAAFERSPRSPPWKSSTWMPPSEWPCTKTSCVDSAAWRAPELLLSCQISRSNHAALAQICVGGVLLHHALRIKERAVNGDGVLHDFQKSTALIVVQRKNHSFQLGIECFGLLLAVSWNVAASRTPGLPDRPARDSFNVAFHPPAVQNAQARHAVQRRFHPACARRLERKLRRVQPKVHAGSNFSAHFEVVIIQEYNRDRLPQRFFCVKDAANDVLPSSVIRMRFACINNLEGARVLGNLPQAVEVGEDEIRALISGGTPRKTNGENFGIELETCLRANHFKQFVFRDQVRRPHFFRWEAERAAKAVIIRAPGRNVAVEELLKRWTSPRARVNTVGYRLDRHFRKHQARSFAVLLGDAVDIGAETQRELRHVEGCAAARRLLKSRKILLGL